MARFMTLTPSPARSTGKSHLPRALNDLRQGRALLTSYADEPDETHKDTLDDMLDQMHDLNNEFKTSGRRAGKGRRRRLVRRHGLRSVEYEGATGIPEILVRHHTFRGWAERVLLNGEWHIRARSEFRHNALMLDGLLQSERPRLVLDVIESMYRRLLALEQYSLHRDWSRAQRLLSALHRTDLGANPSAVLRAERQKIPAHHAERHGASSNKEETKDGKPGKQTADHAEEYDASSDEEEKMDGGPGRTDQSF